MTIFIIAKKREEGCEEETERIEKARVKRKSEKRELSRCT